MEKFHKGLSLYLERKNQRLLVDLTDVIFSLFYGFKVMKLEAKHFYKAWINRSHNEHEQ